MTSVISRWSDFYILLLIFFFVLLLVIFLLDGMCDCRRKSHCNSTSARFILSIGPDSLCLSDDGKSQGCVFVPWFSWEQSGEINSKCPHCGSLWCNPEQRIISEWETFIHLWKKSNISLADMTGKQMAVQSTSDWQVWQSVAYFSVELFPMSGAAESTSLEASSSALTKTLPLGSSHIQPRELLSL